MIDDMDRKILNLIQEAFPLDERPFARLGESLGIGEAEVLSRVKRLKASGYIRRIGPVLERKKLGFASALCAAHVDDDRIVEVAGEISKQPGITHNYEREGELNLWFTVSKKTGDEIEIMLREIEEKFSIKVYRFPEKRVFKIKTYFPL